MVNKKRVGMMVAVTLLTGVLLFCSVFFLVRRANREITQRSFDELTTATHQIAKDLVETANADQTILSAMTDFVHMMAQGLDVPEGKITALSRFYAAALEGLTSQWLRDGMTEDLAPFIADLGELLDGNIRLSLERCVRKEN